MDILFAYDHPLEDLLLTLRRQLAYVDAKLFGEQPDPDPTFLRNVVRQDLMPMVVKTLALVYGWADKLPRKSKSRVLAESLLMILFRSLDI